MLTVGVIDDRDAFAGGFLAGIVQGKSLETAVDMGQWLASLSIRELGPSYVPPLLVSRLLLFRFLYILQFSDLGFFVRRC